MNRRSLWLMTVLVVLAFSMFSVFAFQQYDGNHSPEVSISHLKVGYFGLTEGTNVSYPKNLSQNSEFRVSMEINGNVTSVYTTTPGFKIVKWSELNGFLVIHVSSPDFSYEGVLAMHVVGKVPFSLIY